MHILQKQAYGFFEPTLGDLTKEVRNDGSLDHYQKQFTAAQVYQAAGTHDDSMPLTEIITKLGSSGLGFLVAKYFKMSTVGRLVSTAVGYGVGKVIYDFFKTHDNHVQWTQY